MIETHRNPFISSILEAQLFCEPHRLPLSSLATGKVSVSELRGPWLKGRRYSRRNKKGSKKEYLEDHFSVTCFFCCKKHGNSCISDDCRWLGLHQVLIKNSKLWIWELSMEIFSNFFFTILRSSMPRCFRDHLPNRVSRSQPMMKHSLNCKFISGWCVVMSLNGSLGKPVSLRNDEQMSNVLVIRTLNG